VTDTNALIWYLRNDPKLSKIAKEVFEAAERGETLIVIHAIVFAELYYANQKWNLFKNFAQLYTDIQQKSYFRIVPMKADEVLDFDLNNAVPEMHDRIIAGLARRLNAPLITSDALIMKAGIVQVVW
jgi:PIN domain nuclease of toxin-antitoxin system